MTISLKSLFLTATLMLIGIESQCTLPKLPIPFTNLCLCYNFFKICNRAQSKDQFCQCACPAITNCFDPKAQDQNDCECKCKVDSNCKSPKYTDVDTCQCLCPKKQCRSNQIQSQTTCNCECPNKGEQCPFWKRYDEYSCSCKCLLPAICLNPDKVWDPIGCQCVFKSSQQTQQAHSTSNSHPNVSSTSIENNH